MIKLNKIDFPESQYYNETQNKRQIVLHHTVSDPESVIGDINSWLSDKERIATYGIISLDGTLNKCFPSDRWANHLGVKSSFLKAKGFEDYKTRNKLLSQQSIAIELDAWGGLTKDEEGQILNAYGRPINYKLDIVECQWRGFGYFQRYSDSQINTLKELLEILMKAWKIPNRGLVDGNFDVRMDALSGESGIYSHTNFREDKSDLYPDQRIINMLKSLNV